MKEEFRLIITDKLMPRSKVLHVKSASRCYRINVDLMKRRNWIAICRVSFFFERPNVKREARLTVTPLVRRGEGYSTAY